MNGVGGDVMIIFFNAKDQKYYGYNGSGRSSKAVTKIHLQQQLDALNLTYIPATGPLPVSVPGAVKGWCVTAKSFYFNQVAILSSNLMYQV